MKRTRILLISLAMIICLVASSFAGVGNGAPTGPHYNLNIIGVKDKTAEMTEGNGHVIFMPLYTNPNKTPKIMLTEGDDFAVLDKNGTDKDGATFQLPNPDPLNTGTTEYSVFARALGKPNKDAVMTTGASYEDPETGELIEMLSVISFKPSRKPGKSTFENVSAELLYVYVDLDGDGDMYELERYNIFADEMQDYFWEYDNHGLKLLQLRFYPISTTVPEADDLVY